MSIDGYSSDLEFTRQCEVENRFFRTERTKPWKHRVCTDQIHNAMERIRTSRKPQDDLDLTGVPARVVIVAERLVNQNCFPVGTLIDRYGFFTSSPLAGENKSVYKHLVIWWTQLEKVVLRQGGAHATITYVQKTLPHMNHKGDCRVDFAHDGTTTFIESHEHGSYSCIGKKILELTAGDQAKEADIATLLLRFARKLSPITKQDLAKALGVEETAVSPDHIAFINTLGYLLFVKEIARRQDPEAIDTHYAPWATSIIRALRLVKDGHLRLLKVLDANSKLGAFTGISIGQNMGIVEEKIRRINRMYRGLYPETPSSKDPKQSATARWALKQELTEVFGGASDTDDAGYESA